MLLVKLMEDHPEDVVVIAAGYAREMESFASPNLGLASRFGQTAIFDDYTPDEFDSTVSADDAGLVAFRSPLRRPLSENA